MVPPEWSYGCQHCLVGWRCPRLPTLQLRMYRPPWSNARGTMCQLGEVGNSWFWIRFFFWDIRNVQEAVPLISPSQTSRDSVERGQSVQETHGSKCSKVLEKGSVWQVVDPSENQKLKYASLRQFSDVSGIKCRIPMRWCRSDRKGSQVWRPVWFLVWVNTVGAAPSGLPRRTHNLQQTVPFRWITFVSLPNSRLAWRSMLLSVRNAICLDPRSGLTWWNIHRSSTTLVFRVEYRVALASVPLCWPKKSLRAVKDEKLVSKGKPWKTYVV